MRQDAMRAGLAREHRAETGGWWCYGKCQAWTELDSNREQAVCVMCGRPTVKLLPPARAEGPEPRRAVSPEQARRLFDVLREAVNQTTERNHDDIRACH